MKYLWIAAAMGLVWWGVGPAHAERNGQVSRANLPPGWAWPPSASMQQSGERCLQELARTGLQFERVSKPVGRINTPVVVPSNRFGLLELQYELSNRPPVMDCQLALALTRHAEPMSAMGIRRLIVGGIYKVRRARLRGRSTNLLSRHALGLAVDVRAFLTHRGRWLTVERHYRRPLVQRVEQLLLSSEELRAVVTPGNDPAHRDHFHISAKMTIDERQPDRRLVQLGELWGQPARLRP